MGPALACEVVRFRGLVDVVQDGGEEFNAVELTGFNTLPLAL